MTVYREMMIGLLQAVEIEKGKDHSEFQNLFNEQLKDPKFKKEWDAFQTEIETNQNTIK